MDRVRAAMGDQKLNYFGFSYGTYLGRPTQASSLTATARWCSTARSTGRLREPADGEPARAIRRVRARPGAFLPGVRRKPGVLRLRRGGSCRRVRRPHASAYVHPLPATGDDPRPVDGDDVVAAGTLATYAKQLWPLFADALRQAQSGDGTGLRQLADFFYGRNPDGTYDPITDRYFLITALDQNYQHVRANEQEGDNPYITAGNHSWGLFDHTWWNAGYVELNYGLFDVQPNDVYRGPFKASPSAPTVLEVATTYDPATPYRGALRTPNSSATCGS